MYTLQDLRMDTAKKGGGIKYHRLISGAQVYIQKIDLQMRTYNE